MSTNLITVEEVVQQVDMGVSTDHEALIAVLIEDCIAEAESYMDAKVNKVSGEEIYLDGGLPVLFLPHLNINNVSVWEDGNLLDSTEYVVYQERGKLKKKKGGGLGWTSWATGSDERAAEFLGGELIIKVQYDGGYDSLPRDLKRKLIAQIAYVYRRRRDPGVSAVTYPDGTINKIDVNEWLPDVQKVLDRYARIIL